MLLPSLAGLGLRRRPGGPRQVCMTPRGCPDPSRSVGRPSSPAGEGGRGAAGPPQLPVFAPHRSIPMPKVLISDALSPAAVEIFRERGIDVDVKTGLKPDELKAIIGDYDGQIGRASCRERVCQYV